MLLYVHIPFCESKCPYCAFGSVVGAQKSRNDYFEALVTDFKEQILKFNVVKNSITSVFIGGGTPSAVNANLYENLFLEILPFLTQDCEITTEANPNSASLKWLETMKKSGVNRISFGAQSFFEDKLKFLGRIHGKNEIYEAVQNAKTAGFDNINVDLIYGTKLDTKKRLAKEIENIANLNVSHLSAYSLTLEENTPFYGKINYKKDSPILANFIIKEIENIGLKQYEISNFGRVCKHNLGYWQGKNYLALGAYAVGFYKDRRLYNAPNINAYAKDPHAKKIEILSSEDLRLESIFLGARSIVGIDKKRLNIAQKKQAEILVRTKKLELKNGKFFNKNFLLADEISLFING